jgi:hypothetical protein
MEEIIKMWLPIGAFLISIISIVISLSNFRFARKFEAAKKRTELLSNVLATISILKNKRDQLLLVNRICEGCPKSQAESICAEYDAIIKDEEEFYQKVESLTDIADPIQVEHAIAKNEQVQKK